MKREDYINKIRNNLALMTNQLDLSKELNMHGLNIIIENFYRELLNLIFDWRLVNGNYGKNNLSGVDLYSESDKITIQISSTINRSKIQHSLNTIDNEIFKDYEFIFIGIGIAKNELNIKRHNYKVPNDIKFNPKCNIWDNARLFKEINNLELDKIKKVFYYFEKNFENLDEKINSKIKISSPVPSSIDYFMGREDELSEIENLIEIKKPLFIWGDPGIGKTEIAINFAKRCSEIVYFTTFQGSIKNTINNVIFIDLTSGLRINDYSEKLDILRQFSDKVLLIIDNFDAEQIDDPDILREEESYVELCNMDLKVIFTTRTNYGEGVHINPLSNDILLKLICYFYNNKNNDLMVELIQTLQNNTVLVELCARLLEQSNGFLTPEKLLEELKSYNISDLKTSISINKDRTIKDAFSKQIFTHHLGKLYKLTKLTEEEKQIISCASLLPINGFSYKSFINCEPLSSNLNSKEILQLTDETLIVKADNYKQFFFTMQGTKITDIDFLFMLTKYDDRIEEDVILNSKRIIDTLIQKGWIRHDKTNDVISVHPMLSIVCFENENVQPTLKRSIAFIKRLSNTNNVSANEYLNGNIYSQAKVLLNAIEQFNRIEDYGESIATILMRYVMNIAIKYDSLETKSKDTDALEALQYHFSALNLFKLICPDSIDYAICCDSIAAAYRETENYDKSLEYFFIAKKIFEKSVILESNELNDLYAYYHGRTYLLMEKYRTDDDILSDLCTCYHGIGLTYGLMGEHIIRKEYYEKILNIRKDESPINEIQLAKAYMNMSFVLQDMEDYNAQANFLFKANSIYEQLLPNLLYEWINSCYGLYVSHKNIGDQEKAQFFYNKIEQYL